MLDPGLYQERAGLAGQGLFATTTLQDGQQIAIFERVINAQQLVLHEVQNHGRLLPTLERCVRDELVPLTEVLILTMYLAIYRGSSSSECQDAAYIATLPSALANGLWTDENLSGTALASAIEAKRLTTQRQHAVLGKELCSFEDWRWAASMVQSRTIGLPEIFVDEDREEVDSQAMNSLVGLLGLNRTPGTVLVPTLDLCNHAGVDHNARWEIHRQADGTILVELLAHRGINAHEEITLSYGNDKANEELFFNYGFVCKDNPCVQAALILQPEERAVWQEAEKMFGFNRRLHFKVDTSTTEVKHNAKLDAPASDVDLLEFWSEILHDPSQILALVLAASLSLLESIESYCAQVRPRRDWQRDHHIRRAAHVLETLLRERMEMLRQIDSDELIAGNIRGTLLKDEYTCLNAVRNALEKQEIDSCREDGLNYGSPSEIVAGVGADASARP